MAAPGMGSAGPFPRAGFRGPLPPAHSTLPDASLRVAKDAPPTCSAATLTFPQRRKFHLLVFCGDSVLGRYQLRRTKGARRT